MWIRVKNGKWHRRRGSLDDSLGNRYFDTRCNTHKTYSEEDIEFSYAPRIKDRCKHCLKIMG